MRHPLLMPRDLGIAAELLALLPLSWALPERFWPPVAIALGRAAARLAPGRTRTRVHTLESVMGTRSDLPDARRIHLGLVAGGIEQFLQHLRELRPGGWSRRIRLVGRDHVERALTAGSGAVLWVAPFLFGDLLPKKAFHDAGLSVTHLGIDTHGPSYSRLGTRLLNPLQVVGENRYLAERLAMSEGTELKYSRRMVHRLRANGLVSMGCAPVGRKIVPIPLFGGRLPIATGAPSLSLATGAALLPVFTLRSGPDRFEVVVEPPLAAAPVESRHEAVDDLLRCFVARLESMMLAHPMQCLAWRSLRVGDS